MRILPDAKDLINTVEHNRGVTFSELESYTLKGKHKIILSSTNILEFAASLPDTDDFLQMRSLLQRIEQLPLLYIKEWTIPYLELIAAKEAFDNGHEYPGIDPYVGRWDDTIAPLGRPTPTAALVGFRIDEAIRMLWKADPNSLRFPSKEVGNLIRDQYKAKRSSTPAPRSLVKKEFGKAVEQLFRHWNIDANGTDVAKLADWIYADPARCPGLRIHHDMRYELLGAISDKMQDNDTQDFAYLYAIPYVDAITLDRRITAYATAVARRLKKLTSSADYTSHIFPNIGALMKAHP